MNYINVLCKLTTRPRNRAYSFTRKNLETQLPVSNQDHKADQNRNA